jgi:hypothetical protein
MNSYSLRWFILLIGLMLLIPGASYAVIFIRGLPSGPVRQRADWADGVAELINDPVRTQGWTVNDVHAPTGYDVYAMNVNSTEDANRLIRKLGAIKGRAVRLELGTSRSIGSLPVGGESTVLVVGPNVDLAAWFQDEPIQVDANLKPPAPSPILDAKAVEAVVGASSLQEALQSRLSLERMSPATQPGEPKPIKFDGVIAPSPGNAFSFVAVPSWSPPRPGMSLGQSTVYSYSIRPTKAYPYTLRLLITPRINVWDLDIPENVEVGGPAYPPVVPNPTSLNQMSSVPEIQRFIESVRGRQKMLREAPAPTTRAGERIPPSQSRSPEQMPGALLSVNDADANLIRSSLLPHLGLEIRQRLLELVLHVIA